jgi:dephospho-CoA kinase
MLVIGLTGGIGTGKSLVAHMLGELGAEIIDADRIGHEAYTPHTPVWKEVVEAFGEDILQTSGEIDRKRLGSIVFSDPKELARLNSIMHPRMAEMIHKRVIELEGQGADTVVVEAAVLVEAGWDKLPWVDEVWVTKSDEEQVVQRIKKRNNLPDEEIRKRIGSQLPFEKRSRNAQVVVDNSGAIDDLKQAVESIWESRVKGKVS